MEFDTTTAARSRSDIDDEARLSAATKRVTLTPLHEDVHPDLKPNGSSESGLGVPVANIPSDMEDTSSHSDTAHPLKDENVSPTPLYATAQPATTQENAQLAPTAPSASFLPATPPTQPSSKLPLIIGGSIVVVGVLAVIGYSLLT